jgi:hypothetical protein
MESALEYIKIDASPPSTPRAAGELVHFLKGCLSGLGCFSSSKLRHENGIFSQ